MSFEIIRECFLFIMTCNAFARIFLSFQFLLLVDFMSAELAKPNHHEDETEIGIYMDPADPVTHLVFVGGESSITYPIGIGAEKCEVKKPKDGAEIRAYFKDGEFHLEIKGNAPCKGRATINFDNGTSHKFNYEILES